MRIFNEDKTEEIQEYNSELYYLVEDRLFIKHHDAVEEIQQTSHYEIIRTNELTGGVEYGEIIDTPYQPAKEAYDEYEDILIAIPYTEQEIKQSKITKLDNWFEKDYRKYCEMFTRREALGIEDVIEDEFRNRVGENAYHNLIELYEEAEIVAKEIRELRS